MPLGQVSQPGYDESMLVIHEESNLDIDRVGQDSDPEDNVNDRTDQIIAEDVKERMNTSHDSLNSGVEETNALMQSKRNQSVYPLVQQDDSMLFGIKQSQSRMTISYSPAQIVRSQTMGNNLRQDQE